MSASGGQSVKSSFSIVSRRSSKLSGTAGDSQCGGTLNQSRRVIGPGGGFVGLPDSSAQVLFPAGAVTQNTTVQLTRTAAPALPTGGQQLVSSAVDFTATDPSGAGVSTFAQPVQITLAFAGPPPAGVFFFNPSSGTWQPVEGGSTVNQGAATVVGVSSHFTVFAALTEATATAT